jgi:DNA-binding FadR family transcriptional regulator
LRAAYRRVAEPVAGAMASELKNIRGYNAIALAVERRDPRAAERAARAHVTKGLAPMLALFDGIVPEPRP